MYNQLIKCLILSFITTTSFSGRVIGEEMFHDMEDHPHVDDLENAYSLDHHRGKEFDETLDEHIDIEDEDEEEGKGGNEAKSQESAPPFLKPDQEKTLDSAVSTLNYYLHNAPRSLDEIYNISRMLYKLSSEIKPLEPGSGGLLDQAARDLNSGLTRGWARDTYRSALNYIQDVQQKNKERIKSRNIKL